MNQNSTEQAPRADPLILTQRDVARLLTDDSADSRTQILHKIATHYHSPHLQERERAIAEQIFRLLMKDVALRVRESLALHLQDNATIPRDILLHLAQDVTSVASPLLRHNAALSDADLVGIIESSNDLDKIQAIITRPKLSVRITDALVETRYIPVMQALLANEGAIISDFSLERIADDFCHDPSILAMLSQREELPLAVVERIVVHASEEVAARLRTRYKLSHTRVDYSTQAVREGFMLRLLERHMTDEELEALTAHMVHEGRLTASIVLSALGRGQLQFFTFAIARLANISPSNAQRLIADRGVHGFNGLYQKAGLPPLMGDATRLLLRVVQDMQMDEALPGTALYANRLAERLIIAADGQEKEIEYFPYFLALIRQNAPHRVG